MSYKITDTIIVDQNKNIGSIGIATFAGPVIIGGGTSTGTVSQPLQVTGSNGAYIGGNLGIGSTNPSSKLWVSGDIYNTGIHTAQVLNASKDPGTGIATDFTNSLFGNGWRVSSPGSTTYYKLATLPPGGGGSTFDHLTINGVLGAWTNGNQTPFEITFSNRGAFNYKYISYGSVRSDVRIIGISTNSNVEIWAQHQASQFTKLVYNIANSIQAVIVSNPTSTTTAPTGTTVFDSSTVTPRFIINESDNVGIGTTNPPDKLTVFGNLQIQQNSGSNNRFVLRGQPTSSYRWNIDNYGSANDFRIFREDDATAANGSVAVSISTIGTLTATKFSGDGSLLTNLPGGSGVSQWVTTSVGIHTLSNVGIGTTNPTSKLHVVGDVRVSGVVTATTFVGNLTGTASSISGGAAGNIVYQSGPNATAFLTNGGSGTVLQSNGVGNLPTWVAAAPSGAVSGITVRDSNSNLVGTSGSITQLTFGTGLSVTGTTGAAGIATITLSSNIVGSALSISGISTFNNTLNVVPTATSIAGLFSGTTSSDMVRITQLGSGNALVVEDSTNPDATPFVVKGDGSVGIGTNNPTVTLQLSPTASISNVGSSTTLAGTVGSALTVAQFLYYNLNASYLRIKATRNATGSDWLSASTKLVNVTDVTEQGYIEYNPNGALSGMAFGSDATEWARFLSSGNLGIGTTNPTSKLHVVGNVLIVGVSTLGVTSTTNLTSQQLNVSGITTLGVTSTTNLTSQQLNVSGITTLGVTSTTNLTSQQLNVSGITTLGVTSATNLTSQQLNVSGITTLGVVTSGNIYSTGIVTATQFSTGSGTLGFTTNTINGPSEIIIDPSPVGVGTTSGIVRIRGDLYVDGTQFVVNSTTIELADLRVGIATTVGTSLLLDGGGIGIGSANIIKTITWNHTAQALTSSEDWNLASGKQYEINNTSVLTSTTLGSGVVNSSLTSVGTLGSLNVSGTSTFQGQIQSTQANNTATGGGQIYLNGATGNRIDFNTNGVAAPTFTTRSVGTKIVLYPNVGAGQVDYALGIESSTLWSSVESSTSQFKWYAGTTNIATLFGTGELVLGTTTKTGTASQPLQVTGDTYVSGNLGIGNTNPQRKLHLRATNADGIFLDGSDQTGNSGAPTLRVRGQRVDGNASQSFSGQLVLERWRMDASINSGQNLGAIIFGGNYHTLPGITTGMTYGASIGAMAEGTFSGIGTAPTAIVFNTGTVGLGTLTLANATYGTEAARITSNRNLLIGTTSETGTASQRLQVTGGAYVSGSVGIGTTNPAYKLSVYGNAIKTSADGSPFVISSNDATNPFQLLIARSSSSVTKPYWSIESVEQNVAYRNLSLLPSGGNVTIGSTLDTGTSGQVLQVAGINSSVYIGGNLGIGTTTPTSKLQIVGDVLVSGILTANSFRGDGSQLTGISASGGISISTNTTNQSQYLTYVTGTGSTTGLGVSLTGLVFNPSSGSVGIGITNPVGQLQVSTGPVIIGAATSTGTATQRLQVTGGAYVSGNLGVGVTNPGATLNVVPTATSIAGLFSGTTSSDMVRITQLGSGNALVVEDSANPDSSPFVVTGIGSVGIGTASPAFTADIAGDARVTSTNKMRFGGTAGTTNFYIQYNSTTNSLDFVAG